MNKTPQAFTLVELVVVVAILAILATIGFVSYSGYLVGVRDTSRISQLSAIHDGLEMYRTRKDLPNPENSVEVKVNGTTIGNQGYMGKANLEIIEYSKEGVDPKDGTYYSYYVTEDKKYFQLMGFLEEEERSIVSYKNKIIGQAYASVDYSERYPKVIGKKLGILTNEDNTPIQEIASIQTATLLDVGTATGIYIAHLGKDDMIEGTGAILPQINPEANCKRILQMGKSNGDGVYTINPTGTGAFQVYCDMTTDGGGWTLVEGYKDTYAEEFKQKDWDSDYPINENNPDIFDKYRLSYSKMQSLWNISTRTHARCHKDINQSLNDYVYIDKGFLTDTACGVEISKWNALGKVAGISIPKTGLIFCGGLNNSWHWAVDGISSLGGGGSTMEYFTWHDNDRGGNTHKCWDTVNGGIYLWFLR